MWTTCFGSGRKRWSSCGVREIRWNEPVEYGVGLNTSVVLVVE